MPVLGIVALSAALGGCASSSAEITSAYVSPVMYQLDDSEEAARASNFGGWRVRLLAQSLNVPIRGAGPLDPALGFCSPSRRPRGFHLRESAGRGLFDSSRIRRDRP